MSSKDKVMIHIRRFSDPGRTLQVHEILEIVSVTSLALCNICSAVNIGLKLRYATKISLDGHAINVCGNIEDSDTAGRPFLSSRYVTYDVTST